MPPGTERKPTIFVSYAHADNGIFPGADCGWVTRLIDSLDAELPKHLDRREEVKCFFDRKALSPNEPLTDQLVQAARRADLLLVILSERYLCSDWCGRERNEFLGAVRERGRSKVFIVRIQDIDRRREPEEFRDLLGVTFWKKKEEGGTSPLGYPLPDPKNPAHATFYDKLQDLCEWLAKALKQPSGPPPEVSPETGAIQVFLAPVRYDLEEQWESVRRYLDQAGLKVVPESAHAYPLEPGPFRNAAEQQLADCKLFVQLLSENPFKEPPDPTDYAQLLVKLAQSLRKPIPILQWRHPQIKLSRVTDESQHSLLDAETVRAQSIEDFKQEVRRRAFEAPPTPEPPPPAYVLVDSTAKDRPLAGQIRQALDKYKAAYVTLEAPESGEVRPELEKGLVKCHALIVVYGESPSDWVIGQWQQWHKSNAIRKRPANALALFDGPPETKQGQVGIPGAQLVDCRKGFDELKLKHFLDEVHLGATQ